MTTQETNQAVKNAVREAKRRLGTGWHVVGPTVREAMVSLAAVSHFAAIDEDHASAETARKMIAVAQAVRGMDFE
jgi:hypothetical protein